MLTLNWWSGWRRSCLARWNNSSWEMCWYNACGKPRLTETFIWVFLTLAHAVDKEGSRFSLCWKTYCEPHFSPAQNSGLWFETFAWFSWVFTIKGSCSINGVNQFIPKFSQRCSWPIREQKYPLFAKCLSLYSVPTLNAISHGISNPKLIPFFRITLEGWPNLWVNNTKNSWIARTVYRKSQ